MKKILAAFISISTVLLSVYSAFAFDPYEGYTYDEFGRQVPSVSGYSPLKTVYHEADKKYSFESVQDMFIDDSGDIYLLYQSTGSILILDNDYAFIKEISDFKDTQGEAYTLNTPSSLFVTEDKIYIADTENDRVVISDEDGTVSGAIYKPESEIFPQHRDFKPTKVIVDSVGNIYAIVSGVFQGAATFDSSGRFVEFFGSDRVELSARLLRDYLWRRFVTDEMRERLARYVPVEFISFDIDDENFVYSVTQRTSRMGQIRKINPAGVNIWTDMKNYGDIEFSMSRGRMVDTYFADVTINHRGFLFALDSSRNRVFVYDKEGDFVFTFAGKGNQEGTFLEPRVIESYGDKIYVYDSAKRSITEFVPNEYGGKVLSAIEMFQDGRYVQSKELWEDVLKHNTNNYLAYVGIGKALYHTGDYKEAMKYHELGGNKRQESLAFEKFRASLIRENFLAFTLLLVLVVVVMILAINRKKLKGYFKLRSKNEG